MPIKRYNGTKFQYIFFVSYVTIPTEKKISFFSNFLKDDLKWAKLASAQLELSAVQSCENSK